MENILPYLALVVFILLLGISIWVRTKIVKNRKRDEEKAKNRWYTFSE